MEASMLILPRPMSIQANYGFPKLGEYLVTGNPVIVTPVGDIPLYLKNKVNAYFTKPGDIESLVDICTKLIENESISEKIGKNGKNSCIEIF